MNYYLRTISFLVVFALVAILSAVLYTQYIIQQSFADFIPMVSPLPATKQILFVSNRAGNYDIYHMDLAHKHAVNITNDPSDDMNPQVSPDGRYVVFYSNRDGDEEIYRLDMRDHELLQFTHNTGGDFDPTYSPDGQYITFKSDRDDSRGDIFIMNADGTNQRNLTKKRKTTEEWDPTFNKDGSKIIFVVRHGTDHRTDEMFSMNVDGTAQTQLTSNNVSDWYPSSSPIEQKLLYISKVNMYSLDDIFTRTEDGEILEQLTDLLGNDADPAWDFAGEQIVFINDADGDYDLYIMDADGSFLQKIEDTPSDELSPIFLPEKTIYSFE